MKLRKIVTILVSSALLGGLLAAIAPVATPAEALTASEFDPGYIISDQNFFNKDSMTEAQIQAFLVAKNPVCHPVDNVPCIKDYQTDSYSKPASVNGQCLAYTGATQEPASRIIYKVAQACGINPQVLLVLLQKEQSLITDDWPSATQYRIAMGYGCPDTAACDSAYYGFYNQVYRAAWQFRAYTIFPNDWHFRIGNVAIQYHPYNNCAAPVVNIRNQATANLYNYTPYQPNAAALANLGGEGDSCSSYGNRNFWVFYSNWFGSPTGLVNPFGNIELLAGALGGIRVAGWAIEPDSTDPVTLHVYVDGVVNGVLANGERPDLATAYPGKGTAHGFDVTVPVLSGGTHEVCIWAINVGPGSNTLWRCANITTASGSPFGVTEGIVGGLSGVSVDGWIIDPDTSVSTSIAVKIDGGVTSVSASNPRADVQGAYPGYGALHGFSAVIPATSGSHQVCLTGINIGVGSDVPMGCKSVMVAGPPSEAGRSPIGIIDDVSGGPSGLTISGWALDPDTDASIVVHAYVDGGIIGLLADQPRPDIAAAFPGYGSNHGLSAVVPAGPGKHTVCFYAINYGGAGGNPSLGCRTARIDGPPSEEGRAPFGSYDGVTSTGDGFAVAGWVIDPDTTSPVTIHVYVDGTPAGFVADQSRPDVAGAYPGYGDLHGFNAAVLAPPGSHEICVFAINTGPGPNPFFGCRVVSR